MVKKEKEGQGCSGSETPPGCSSSACCTYTCDTKLAKNDKDPLLPWNLLSHKIMAKQQ